MRAYPRAYLRSFLIACSAIFVRVRIFFSTTICAAQFTGSTGWLTSCYSVSSRGYRSGS